MMRRSLRDCLWIPASALALLAALPNTSAASVTVSFSSMGTVTTPMLNFPDGAITGDNGVSAADVHMLNLNGLGVVGGSANTTVDGAEGLHFQFTSVVVDVRYFVQLGNNLNGNGLVGESTIEAFVGATSLGTVPVNSTGWKAVSTLFGGVGITRFTVRANVDGVRIGALEYTVNGTISTPFCLGDGTGAACPCGNTGALGRGCASSAFVGGALLTASGTAGASAGTDSLVLTASDIPGPGLFFQASGLAALPAALGDGLLCATAGIQRLGVVFPSGNVASYPGGLTPAPIHIAGATASGDTRYYQCWYRSVPGLCSVNNFDLTQGVGLVWGP
ncbi:MAG: hypothetical protein JNL28_00815 [Planctomycetes bacterium]|nr:hypothetical protein [Planctomycetota bacterium]